MLNPHAKEFAPSCQGATYIIYISAGVGAANYVPQAGGSWSTQSGGSYHVPNYVYGRQRNHHPEPLATTTQRAAHSGSSPQGNDHLHPQRLKSISCVRPALRQFSFQQSIQEDDEVWANEKEEFPPVPLQENQSLQNKTITSHQIRHQVPI